MSRIKYLTLLAVVLLMTLPAGLAQAQEPAGPIRTAVIWDNVALSDAITYSLAEIAPPAAGTAYEGWLWSDDGSVKLSTGSMDVQDDGTIDHTYVSPDVVNLIELYDKVVITVEPVPDDDPGPSDVILLSHAIPAGGMVHIRHLLVLWTEPADSTLGIISNLQAQLDVAILHSDLALSSDTIENVRLHTHHVINIIEGAGGANFDASFENPGDGWGAIPYAQNAQIHANLAIVGAPGDEVVAAHAALVDVTGQNAETWAAQARDVAVDKALPEAGIALAKVWVQQAKGLLLAARSGLDADVDGTIGSISGEGGADQADVEAQLMATFTLTPGPPVAGPSVIVVGAGSGLGLPIVGDSSVPLLAQMALITALVFLVAGGALVVRGGRSRTRA